MSCNICQKKFSFFNRENGCPNCGFSYCSKCLKYKVELPKVGVKKVCGRCFNKFNAKKMSTDDTMDTSPESAIEKPLPPVDITNKLESLENPSKPPIVMYKQESTHWDKLKVGMDPADQEIIDRLMKLKGEDKQRPPPSIDEINRRLALLKNQDPDNIEKKSIDIHHIDTRTNEEKREDLLKEYLDKLNIGDDSVGNLQSRLDSLKGLDPSKISSHPNYDEDEDEETVTKKIIKQALEEAAIEAKFGTDDTLEEVEVTTRQNVNDDEDDEEAMCEDCGDTDGLTYCKGCKEKLYCSLCFEDNHDEDEVDMKKHIRVPFNKM